MSSAVTTESCLAVRPMHNAHPLDDFYTHAGRRLPEIEMVRGEEVPQPYRKLLVHEGDMTPTLENFYDASIHLEVLQREKVGDFYFRQVVLHTDDTNQPVEFGAIKIFLKLFPPAAQQEILEERLPLGTILAKYKIPHLSRPKGFARVVSDGYINGALKLSGNQVLYGRRNTLSTPDQHVLAEIFEILPPEPN